MSKKLTFIVPIASRQEKFDELISWINQLDESKIQIIAVFDEGLEGVWSYEALSIKSRLEISATVIVGTWGNPGGARNAGLTAASTKWISFVDSDDIVDPVLYLELTTLLEQKDKLFGYGNYQIHNLKKSAISNVSMPSNVILREIRIGMSPGLWRFIFSRELIGNIQFPQINWGEDQAFLALLNLSVRDGEFFPQSMYEYRTGRTGQLTTQKNNANHLIEVVRILLEIRTTRNFGIVECVMFLRICLTAIKLGGWMERRIMLAKLPTVIKILLVEIPVTIISTLVLGRF